MSIAPSHLSTARAVSIVLTAAIGGLCGLAVGDGAAEADRVALPVTADLEVAAAIGELEAAIGREPRNAELRFRLGNLRYATGDMDGAATEYERAVGLSPNFAKAHEHLARVHSRKANYADALAGFTRALALAPDDHETWESRAFSKRDAGLLRGAIEDLTVSAQLAPTQAASRLVRGQLHFDLGAYDEAVSDLREACALDPSNQDEARLYLWLALAAGGDRASASADLAAHLETCPHRSSEWFPAIASFLRGGLGEGELLHIAARGAEGPEKRGRLCEAHFYAGSVKLLAEAPIEAAESLRQCVETGMNEHPEYYSAVVALDRLTGKSIAGAGFE